MSIRARRPDDATKKEDKRDTLDLTSALVALVAVASHAHTALTFDVSNETRQTVARKLRRAIEDAESAICDGDDDADAIAEDKR